MTDTKLRSAAYAVVLTFFATTGASAAVSGGASNVTPDVIFGSGNANGSFTIGTDQGVEIGLRGKLRFNENNQPENTFNFDGVDTYTFRAGTPPTGFGFDPNSPTTPVWNFEWSVNTDVDSTTGNKLDDFTYQLRLDADPGAGTNFASFDPINVNLADHAIGDNTTPNGGGQVATDATEYADLIANNNVAQNSWNYEFFNDSAPLDAFNPNDPGLYTIELQAFSGSNAVASSSINIRTTAVPVPPGLALLATAAAMLGLMAATGSRRRIV